MVVQRRDSPRWLRELDDDDDDDDDDVFAAEAGFVRWSRTVNFKSQLCVVVHDVSETGAHCRPDTLTMLTRSTPFIKIKAGHQSRSFLSVPECN